MLGPRFKSLSYVLFSNIEIHFWGEKTEELKVIPQGEGSGKWGGVWLWVAFFSLKLHAFSDTKYMINFHVSGSDT